LLGAAASAQATPGDAAVKFVDANNNAVANDFVVIRGSDGSVVTPIVESDGSYTLVGIGRKLNLEFAPRGLKQRSVELTLIRAPKVYVTMVIDPETGQLIKEIQQKPYYPSPRVNPKFKKGSQSGQQGIVVPPPNNACATPSPIAVGATAYDTTEATTDGPANGCGSGSQVHNDIWFDYLATGTGTVTISTCNTAAYDTTLAIYNGLGCPPAAPLSCNDDFLGCAGFTSQTSAPVTAGNHYLFRVGGFGASSKGTGTLNVSLSGPPANDECAGATDLACGSSTVFSNATATTNVTDPLFACRVGGPTQGVNSVWFKFVSPGNSAVLDLSNSVVSDTLMALYSGTCGALVQIACDDDGGVGLRSLINAGGLTPGNTYYIEVAGWGAGQVGSLTLDLTCTAPPTPGDDCADAILTTCGTDSVVDNTLYSTDPQDPGYSCHFNGPGNQGVNTVWFKFVATHTSAKLDTNQSLAFDTLLAVYDGTCGAFTELCCSEDEGLGLLSEVCCENLVIGNTYYVQVSSFSAFDVGEITLHIECPCPAPPDNDDCVNAEDLGALPASVTFDNTNATDDIAVPCGVFAGPFRNVWYKVTGTGNTMTATTCNAGTDVSDTIISVFCGDCPSLTCVAGNDDDFACGFGGFLSTVSWCSQAGATYFITVGNFSSGTVPGAVQLDVTEGGSCVPVVQCLPTGACCLEDGTCVTTTAGDCAAQGGTYSGDGTSCTTDFMVDGSFEGGTPSAAWNEASTNFGTPICDPFACGFGGGTGPRTGNFWAWFGGIPANEIGSVDQNVTIPVGATTLDFYLEIPVSSGNGIDYVRLKVDGTILYTAMESAGPYIGYAPVSVPIGAYADGGVHNIRFESVQTGAPGISNFFVDDISLQVQTVSCIQCYTLDFETDSDGNALVHGQNIDNDEEFDCGGSDDPVTITSSSNLAAGGTLANTAAILDSTGGTTQDADLLGFDDNILILQADQNTAECSTDVFCSHNDDEDGGTLTFSFCDSVEPGCVDLIDVDDSGPDEVVIITLTDSSGDEQVYTVPVNWTGDITEGQAGIGTLCFDGTAQAGPGPGNPVASVVTDAGYDSTDVVSIVIERGGDGPASNGGSGAIDNLTWCQ
jgi:hypothetical protein